MLRFCFFVLTFLFILPLDIQAQKVRAEVNVILERLPLEKQDKLVDFQEQLRSYINQNTWCEDVYGHELPIKIQIYLQDASVSYEDRYKGNLLISNSKDMQFYDKRWIFNFNPLEPVTFDENQFHPFTAVIDFYIYILVGGEFDKFGKFEGSPYYEKTQKINQQARFSRFIYGWDERREVIAEILDKDNQSYREALDAYYLGLAYRAEDFSQTLKFCKIAIDLLEKQIVLNPDYSLPHQFIDGHYIEIIDIFKGSEDYLGIFEKLAKIDPDHKDEYKKHL